MAEIIAFKKPKPSEKHRGKTLCRSGFHRWEADATTRFDVKSGKLITREVCRRYGKTRVIPT